MGSSHPPCALNNHNRGISMSVFLQLDGISKIFGGVHALSNMSLRLEKGEVHCLCGQNGCGKSTLIKIMSGVYQPEPGGVITIDGNQIDHLTPVESTRLGVQVIYQDLSLFPNLTVAENIAIGLHGGGLKQVNWKKITGLAADAMQSIGVSLRLNDKVADISIAQRQLVAICRAMAADARLVIMDEPTSSLTRHEVDALLLLTLQLKKRGITIVFVSHRLDEVLEIADRVTVMRDGVKLGTYDAGEMSDRKLATLMTGKEFSYQCEAKDRPDTETVIEVRGLSRAGEYEDINLDVRRGEILGLTGLLGSGRTELALSLFGMTRPDRGEIVINGESANMRSNRDAIERGIAYLPEDRLSLGLVLEQSISANITLSVVESLVNKAGLIRDDLYSATVLHGIDELSIKAGNPENKVKTLSGGNQQRVVLAKWLATHPNLLILDSPTVGVDISAKDGIYQVVRNLAARGIAIIMISDEIPEVYYHSDRVLVMRLGRLFGEYIPGRCSEKELKEALNA
ncbi:monosaccharide ABC transporter ATP-binding protein (CUT2 family) [Sodalis ligni]|uniref:Monosaccharide ABC transporter ATP-binding protein (CUT2 family) n=2 Tax=Sodalis ligni TaxID=2697027 RepID=A0A4R1N970_9GAMM|nr:monosaccharide ABC transporter ATP-binding protein (CUT2 family) [Sodalis ligni]